MAVTFIVASIGQGRIEHSIVSQELRKLGKQWSAKYAIVSKESGSWQRAATYEVEGIKMIL